VRARAPLALVAGALIACVVTTAPVCLAATPEESAAARGHFEKGERHYDLREYEDALREFKDAYRIVPDPVLLYNIGQCHWKLQHRREAVDFYRQYLRRLPNAPNAKEVQARVRELEKDLASTPEPVAPPPTTPPPAPVPAPTAPPPPPPATTTAAPLPTVAPPAPADVATTTVPEPSPEPEAGASVFHRWWFWTAVGVVAAGAAIGIVVATSHHTDVGDCQGLVPCARIGQ
jgi:tetratricopeptide (TPR) repeat protein